MLGAIIGDVVGSRFEFHNHKSKDFELFHPQCKATDDSIMSLAIAQALMETDRAFPGRRGAYYALLSANAVKQMRRIGRKYPHCGFGGMFREWVFDESMGAYNSYGNGAAMRVSPAGFAARSEEEALKLADAVTAVTHSHPEGIKGARATALAIWLARDKTPLADIRQRIARDYYPLDFMIDGIREGYRFNESCQGTVPQAIECFLESASFEDAIRTAVSVGGDSDTLAAITGGIAEAYYGIPDAIRLKGLRYLDLELRDIYDAWAAHLGKTTA